MTESKRTNWKQIAEHYNQTLAESQKDLQKVVEKQVEFRNNYLESQEANRVLQAKNGHLTGERRILSDEIKWLKSVVSVLRDALASQIERQNDD